MYLVTGATGNVGGAVLRRLLELGEPVRALVRAGAEGGLPPGVEVAVGDLSSVDDVVAAGRDAAGLFMLAGYAGLDDGVAELARNGLRRVTLMSSSAATSGDMTNAVGAYHLRTEARLRETPVEWTFLRSYSLMTNVFRWAPQLAEGDRVRLPFADVPIAMVDPDDLAAVAATCLTAPSPEHAGKAYIVSGEQALLPAEQVAAVGRALGRDVAFEAVPGDVARVEMAATTPPEYVDAFFRFFEDGEVDETTVRPTVREVTGRTPATLDDFAQRNLDRLRELTATRG